MAPADDPRPHAAGAPAGGGTGDAAPGRRLVVALVGVALVIAVAGTAVAIATADSRPDPVVPPGTASGPGTQLPDGLSVIAGSVLLGPVVVEDVGSDGRPERWHAVVMVESVDPIAVWSRYVSQMVARSPSSDLDPDSAPGCASDEERSPGEPTDAVCELVVDGITAEMTSVPGDVTGRFLLTLGDRGFGQADDEDPPTWSGDAPPEPEPARDRPDVGEPLAPETVAYEGDDERYVLLEGSELVAQTGGGSITGGFTVLLRVTSGADLSEVTDAYVEQATQFPGEDELPPPEVVEHDDTTFTTRHPPGGAGGYTGVVTAIDRPGDDDYIVYELSND
jgi:hypothetical protein